MSYRLSVRELTRGERVKLTGLIRSNQDARVVRRAQIIHLSDQGQSVQEIAAAWAVHPQTVRRTLQAFNAGGVATLPDKPRRGRPRKTTERYVRLLTEAVQTSPRELGYPFSSWTLDRLREHVGRQTGVLLNPRYLSQVMAKHGIVYRRPKHVMAHLRDAKDYDEKKALLEFLKKARRNAPRPSTCCTSMSVRFTSTRP